MGQRSRVELAPPPANPCSVDATLRYPFMSLHPPEPGLSQSKGPVAGLSCLTKRRPSRRQTSSVARTDILSSVTSMNRPPSPEPIRALIRNAIPNVVVESVSTLTTSQSQRVFSVKVSDGRTLSLRLAPLASGLLRYEQWPILSEARLTKWIFRVSAEQSAENHDESSKHEPDKSHRNKRSSGESQGADPEVSPSAKRRMLNYLPNLVVHSSSPTELGLGFNIFEPTKGTPISNLPRTLTAAERDLVEFQKGRLMRYISEFTSPNGKFGLAVATLEPSMSAEFHGTQQAGLGSDGMTTWGKAFHSLLEAILRDAEDLSVTISYETIRGHFYRLGHLLDVVTVPRLVVLDAAEDSNVLVSCSPDQRGDASSSTATASESQITVTGLCDWSKSIFGDPLFATAFVQDATPAFIRGFRKAPTPPSSPSRDDSTPDSNTASVDISFIEDKENAQIRLLLYECYHATAAVVRQFYRPGADRSEQEIAARRRLTTVLSRLEGVGWEDEIVEARII
ncbi:hypothetical protein F4775DRAFT_267640 [Biscogniauxia sp. FL1348]|nr:hypothetical protein F4775DRAFT_267640 [Biscogniauxia sp. FL1348]